jgi:hypothetical protein
MFYFLFLNIFRRHQRNFHFNPAHFDSGASPLFFIIGNWGISSLYEIRRSSTVYRSICIHTIGKRRRRHQRFPTGSSSSLRCGWCQPPGDSVDASTCSSFFPPFTFSFLGGGRASRAPLDVSLQVCVCHVSYYLTIRLRFPPNRLSLQTLHRVPSFAFEMSTAKWSTILGSFQVLPPIFSCCQRIKEKEKSFTDWGRLAYIFFIAQHSNKHCKLISPDDDDLQAKFPSSCSHPGRTGGRIFDPDA